MKKSGKKILFLLIICLIFMIFLLVMINKKSYAIPEENYSPEENFVLDNIFYTLKTNDVSYNGSSTISGFEVLKHYTPKGDILFSVQVNNNINFGATYNMKDKIFDYGLLYIMANSYPNKNLTDNNGNILPLDFQTWISQVSIWLYLYYAELEDKGAVLSSSSNYLTEEQIYSMMHGREVIVKSNDSNNGKVYSTSGDDTIYDTYIKKLINNALKVRKNSNKTLKVNLEDNDVYITNDNKYYQTSLISVTATPSENFNGYMLELQQAPRGTLVVSENGEVIEDLTNMSVTDKFYLRIPKGNVTEAVKQINIKVIGSFKTYEGNYYESENSQTMVNCKFVNNNIEETLKIDLNQRVFVSDTNKVKNQVIYFGGIFILLCGFYVIYLIVKRKVLKK